MGRNGATTCDISDTRSETSRPRLIRLTPEIMERDGKVCGDEPPKRASLSPRVESAPTEMGVKVTLKDGQFTVVDGPFAEAKELIGAGPSSSAVTRTRPSSGPSAFVSVLGEGEVGSGPSVEPGVSACHAGG